jgi:hypothetical protein
MFSYGLLIIWPLHFHPRSGQMFENSKMGFLLLKAKTSYKVGTPALFGLLTDSTYKTIDVGIMKKILKLVVSTVVLLICIPVVYFLVLSRQIIGEEIILSDL